MRRGIGGTDVGPVVALYRPELAPELAKYANATDVAMRLIHGIERPKRAVMQRGLDAEPRLRRVYVEAYGATLEEHPRPWVVQHPQRPWATCSPDDVVLTDGGRLLLEIKSTSVFARTKWGEPESDDVPALYNLQVQWCMEILGLTRAHVFVGFGRDFKDEHGVYQFLYDETARYQVPRDAELAAMALRYCEQFQTDFIERRKLPPLAPINNKRAYSQLLKGKPWTSLETEATEAPSQS